MVSGSLPSALRDATQVIRCRQDAAEIVRRMSPFSCEPGVVEVQPANHRANIERTHDGLEFVGRTGNSCTARECCARYDGAQESGTGRVIKRLKTAGERIHQAIMRGLVCKIAVDVCFANVVRDVDKHLVGLGPFCRANIVL